MRLGGESSVRGGGSFYIHFPSTFTWCTITTKETIERQIGRDKIFFVLFCLFFFLCGKGFLEIQFTQFILGYRTKKKNRNIVWKIIIKYRKSFFCVSVWMRLFLFLSLFIGRSGFNSTVLSFCVIGNRVSVVFFMFLTPPLLIKKIKKNNNNNERKGFIPFCNGSLKQNVFFHHHLHPKRRSKHPWQ